ncbi:unnamed protein product [Phytophthora lilii]|uniref:Unnamed protein product n=1 Tax=Phytophthora lilii TaxID=2077276 RepID=A0A9W6TPX3_9STRA|nr:unnamed protein product [Phytophthora lilii]
MQRPRSEGRRPASHSQSRSVKVARSLNFGSRQDCDPNQPRRPNTTPKPRIQRLLPAPGQNVTLDWRSRQSATTKLIHLPNSPPRLLPLQSIERSDKSLDENLTYESEENKTKPNAELLAPSASGKSLVPGSAPGSIFNFQPYLDHTNPSIHHIDIKNHVEQNSARCHPAPMMDEDNNDLLEPEDAQQEMSISPRNAAAPLLSDINEGNANNAQQFQSNRGDLGDSTNKNATDDEYEQALAKRKQLLNDEANRQRIRDELETYVESLSLRTDENGEHLVEFPRNYQQIVSLMTQKDVSEEEPKSQDGNHSRQSWSRVLIESGLSKQQAFGILGDGDDGTEGGTSLAAKIALKMARIRQLDTILEEKLGKNLYSSIVTRKQKRIQSLNVVQEKSSRSDSSSFSNRTFVTQTQCTTSLTGDQLSRSPRQSPTNDNDFTPRAKKEGYFIERNKKVVANGMKANMTKDEEDRLEKLLRDEFPADTTMSNDPSDSTKPECSPPSKECNEYTMADMEKKAIEDLIATKSGAYPLFAIDELQDGPTDNVIPFAGESCKESQPAKDNILLVTKRERLQRLRLNRVEQELRFLQESPSVIIVGDDNDADENEDCRSEKSFVTVASSTCSTRSGVISRRDFKCFLAQQKESFNSTPTASAEEIRRLLLSMGHGTSNTVTATTS